MTSISKTSPPAPAKPWHAISKDTDACTHQSLSVYTVAPLYSYGLYSYGRARQLHRCHPAFAQSPSMSMHISYGILVMAYCYGTVAQSPSNHTSVSPIQYMPIHMSINVSIQMKYVHMSEHVPMHTPAPISVHMSMHVSKHTSERSHLTQRRRICAYAYVDTYVYAHVTAQVYTQVDVCVSVHSHLIERMPYQAKFQLPPCAQIEICS